MRSKLLSSSVVADRIRKARPLEDPLLLRPSPSTSRPTTVRDLPGVARTSTSMPRSGLLSLLRSRVCSTSRTRSWSRSSRTTSAASKLLLPCTLTLTRTASPAVFSSTEAGSHGILRTSDRTISLTTRLFAVSSIREMRRLSIARSTIRPRHSTEVSILRSSPSCADFPTSLRPARSCSSCAPSRTASCPACPCRRPR